jgi:disulfide bond formation protein DsbB
MLNNLTPQRAALIVAAVAFATIAGAWVFEYFGYPPCELCLKQRYAYYTGVPFALLLAAIAPAQPRLVMAGLYVLALMWLANAVFGGWHAGIEWKWWAGPTSCTGTGQLSALPDLSKPAAMCDQPSLRIFGISLAGWNAVISLGLAMVALRGTRTAN